MVPEQLEPRLELLREEYVLVQAWKKTASYIRYHNWFSDTLALDRASVNLPVFLGELGERLQSSESWQNDPLRIVPAPKSQRWRAREGVWEPVEKGVTSARLRPLAHEYKRILRPERRAVAEFVYHYHGERNHQGLGNAFVFLDTMTFLVGSDHIFPCIVVISPEMAEVS